MSTSALRPKHVEHRLGERAPPAAAERGFALLRDRAALSRFLARLSADDDALASADHIALPLAAGDRAPHMLVAREGQGITCLGPGMAFAAPVVPFVEVQRFLDAQAEALRAHMAFHRLERDPTTRSPLMRLIKRPHRITREEFLLLRDITPLMVEFYEELVRTQLRFLAQLRDGRIRLPKGGPLLGEAFSIYHAAMIALMASGHDVLMHEACIRAASCGDVALAVRGLWMAVHHPERTLAYAEDAIPRRKPVSSALLLAFAGITARFPAWRKDAMALSRHLSREIGLADTEVWAEHLSTLGPDNLELRLYLLSSLRGLLGRVAPLEVLRERDPPERLRAMGEKLREPGTSLLDAARVLGPWHEEVIAKLRPFDNLEGPARLVPRTEEGRDKAELYRDALFRCLWRDLTVPLLEIGMLLPTLAAGTPVEALTPRDEPEPGARPDLAKRYLTVVLPRVLSHGRRRNTPVKAEAKPQRNAPCPCESGRKYKRCCGR